MADQSRLDNFSTSFLKSDGDILDRSIQPWMLAGGAPKVVVLKVTGDADTLAPGDGQIYFTCPTILNGLKLAGAGASVLVSSSSGKPTIQIARGRRASPTEALSWVDMLSTMITIDESGYDSANASIPAVIDTTSVPSRNDIISATYIDVLRIDVDISGTGAQGLEVRLDF